MEAILAAIGKADNIAVIVLVLCLAGSGYLHIIWRREEREDRKQLYATIEANTRAFDSLRAAIALLTGRVAP